MMPGEKQAETGGVASEATSGTCENCTVLSRSLDEYMAALITLKQKIIDTDHLLTEYKDKCDELQKSQRESSKLHKQLDDVLLKLGPLEKQTVDFEIIKAELEETKTALKSYQQKSAEVDSLREENAKTLALKEKLEDSLRVTEDTSKAQSLENAKLMHENKTLKEDLQKTQESLKICQQAVEEVENLRLQNAKTLIIKSNLENQLLSHEDTKLKQNNEITNLKRANSWLDENLNKTQKKLEELEKEINREKRNTSTQTELEPKVDKGKVRMLLEELWDCLEPLSKTTEMLDLNVQPADSQHLSTLSKVRLQRLSHQPLSASPCRRQIPQSPISTPAKGMKIQAPGTPTSSVLKVSHVKSQTESSFQEQNSPSKEERKKKTVQKKRNMGSEELDQSSTLIDTTNGDCNSDHSSDKECWRNSTDLWEILDCFRPLPSALSPMPFSNEPPEMDDDSSVSSLNKSCTTNDEYIEKFTSESTEPKSLEDTVKAPSINMSPDSLLKSVLSNIEVSLIHPDADNKVIDSFLSENQKMEVEEFCEVKESCQELPCALSADRLQSGEKGECNTIKPTNTKSELSIIKDHSHENNFQLQSVEIPNALCNEEISNGSDAGQQLVTTDHKVVGADDDQSAECYSEAKTNVSEENSAISLNPKSHTDAEPERTVEEIQSSLSPETTTKEVKTTKDLKATEKQNSDNGQGHNFSNTKIDDVSSEGTSKHDELSDGEKEVKRKVSSKLGSENNSKNLKSVTVNIHPLVAKDESEDQGYKKNSETQEKDQLDLYKEMDSTSEDHNTVCKPLVSKENTVINGQQETALEKRHKDGSVNLPKSYLQGIEEPTKQEEHKLSGPVSPNTDMINCNTTSQKEENTEAENSRVTTQDVCPSSSTVLNQVTLSGIDKDKKPSLLTALASRDALPATPLPESIGKVRTEMGPPLPPVVMPLTATPPKFIKTPVRSNVQLPAWLAPEGQQPKVSSLEASLQDDAKMSPCLTTPSPSCGVPSSPLQFGSATPKHAVPVPGRLPSSALNASSPSASQENSMQMLDTMYPELSAQARTLNILRGNVNLGRGGSESGASPPSVNQISGNKTINSSSTAFTKTEQKAKRTGVNVLLPKSAKKLRLDACSPSPVSSTSPVEISSDKPVNVSESSAFHSENSLESNNQEQKIDIKSETKNDELQISYAIEKLQKSCFDVLPVIKSHMFLGRISEVPALRDEEKSVISDFCSNQCSAEELMSAVVTKMKAERAVLKQEVLQSFCRVYVGLCRQSGDIQKAQALAYSILKEDFPEAPKLILFLVTTWPSVLSCKTMLCKAIHTVSKVKAEGEILEYLTTYLHWDMSPPGDIHKMVSSTLNALLEDGNLKFEKHDRHGDDLCPTAWEYIFSLDLMCSHLGWKWTHDNIIGKQLWPIMNAWVTQPRHQQTPVRDICVAAVLRLIGRLGQLGIKEKLCKSVQNVAKAMNVFGKHGITEGVPWEVQLSAVYTIYDLAPINPKEALEALAAWRGETKQQVPLGVTSCITQIGSLCRQLRQ